MGVFLRLDVFVILAKVWVLGCRETLIKYGAGFSTFDKWIQIVKSLTEASFCTWFYYDALTAKIDL
jgi:hypothetical protein